MEYPFVILVAGNKFYKDKTAALSLADKLLNREMTVDITVGWVHLYYTDAPVSVTIIMERLNKPSLALFICSKLVRVHQAKLGQTSLQLGRSIS